MDEVPFGGMQLFYLLWKLNLPQIQVELPRYSKYLQGFPASQHLNCFNGVLRQIIITDLNFWRVTTFDMNQPKMGLSVARYWLVTYINLITLRIDMTKVWAVNTSLQLVTITFLRLLDVWISSWVLLPISVVDSGRKFSSKYLRLHNSQLPLVTTIGLWLFRYQLTPDALTWGLERVALWRPVKSKFLASLMHSTTDMREFPPWKRRLSLREALLTGLAPNSSHMREKFVLSTGQMSFLLSDEKISLQ